MHHPFLTSSKGEITLFVIDCLFVNIGCRVYAHTYGFWYPCLLIFWFLMHFFWSPVYYVLGGAMQTSSTWFEIIKKGGMEVCLALGCVLMMLVRRS
jgi:hypothetical protein